MKAVILAAGRGTRLQPLTNNKSKVMLPLANRPLLEHIIHTLHSCSLQDIIIVCGYRAESIKQYFGKGREHGVNIQYVEQREQLGTAHAILQAEPLLEDDFIVLNGDMLIQEQHLKALLAVEKPTVLTVTQVTNPRDFGVIETRGERVLRILEKPSKPPTNLANTGIYRFTTSIFDYIRQTSPSPRGEYEITTSIQHMIDQGEPVSYLLLQGEWLDIGRPWDLLDANAFLLQHLEPEIKGTVEPCATIKPPVFIDRDTIIRSGTYITGPVIIGKHCDIGPNCYIRPHTSIADNVRIGNAVEVKNSIIMSNTHIGHLSYVGDSIISENCNFGAGTKIANLRHDNRSIRVKIKGELVDSGRRKLGAIMGAGVHTGINSMINVGTIIEDDASILPGELVSGYRTQTKK